MTRFAVIRAHNLTGVETFLPKDYRVISSHAADPFGEYKNIVIEGTDDETGWYGVLALFDAREYKTRHDAEDAACASMN
jgi:hypothetical protein